MGFDILDQCNTSNDKNFITNFDKETGERIVAYTTFNRKDVWNNTIQAPPGPPYKFTYNVCFVFEKCVYVACRLPEALQKCTHATVLILH